MKITVDMENKEVLVEGDGFVTLYDLVIRVPSRSDKKLNKKEIEGILQYIDRNKREINGIKVVGSERLIKLLKEQLNTD